MEFFRELSRNTLVGILTGAFAVVMVLGSIERGFSSKTAISGHTQRRAQHQFQSLVRAHWQQHGATPSQSDMLVYQKQALHMSAVQTKLGNYFRSIGFELPPKQIAKIAVHQPNLRPLLDKLNSNDAKSRADAPMQLEEMKDFIERNSFESGITNSVIIPEYNRERLRRVFMQERTYQWLEIDSSYLEKNDTSIDNEAEIHQYYETHNFPTEASAQIAYVRLDPDQVPQTHISDLTVKKMIEQGELAAPSITQIKATAYRLSPKAGPKDQLLAHAKDASMHVHGLPDSYQSQNLYYHTQENVTLPVSALTHVSLADLTPGKYVFQHMHGKPTIFKVDRVDQSACLSQACIDAVKKQWVAKTHDAQLTTLSTQLQESKLYAPKDIHKLASAHQLKVQTSNHFHLNSAIDKRDSERLRQHVFTHGVKHSAISEPVKLEDGSIVFYKVLEHKPETKAPLASVRQRIIQILHKQHRHAQAEKDTALSVQQLHNGDTIEKIAQKFDSKIHESKSKKQLMESLPTSVLEAADKIPSPHLGWSKPVLVHVPEAQKWFLLALTNVLYTNIHNSSEDNIVKDPELHAVLQRQELNAMYLELLA